MRGFSIFLVLILVGCQSEPKTTVYTVNQPTRNEFVPSFFSEEEFTSASFAEAINHYVGIGERAAVKELRQLKQPHGRVFPNLIHVNVRIGLLCRVLFEPNGGEPIRPPSYGGLLFLGGAGMEYTRWADIRNNWPLFPVALSGSTYFVLSDKYWWEGFGGPEDAKDYISYCHKHGIFRKSMVKVPTKAEAMDDAAALRRSTEWQAIKSDLKGNEEFTWNYIQIQANAIRSQ